MLPKATLQNWFSIFNFDSSAMKVKPPWGHPVGLDVKFISSIFGHWVKWQFGQVALNICHGRFKMFPSTKLTLKMLPKALTILPKRWNFAKSGHTVAHTLSLSQSLLYCHKILFFMILLFEGESERVKWKQFDFHKNRRFLLSNFFKYRRRRRRPTAHNIFCLWLARAINQKR